MHLDQSESTAAAPAFTQPCIWISLSQQQQLLQGDYSQWSVMCLLLLLLDGEEQDTSLPSSSTIYIRGTPLVFLHMANFDLASVNKK